MKKIIQQKTLSMFILVCMLCLVMSPVTLGATGFSGVVFKDSSNSVIVVDFNDYLDTLIERDGPLYNHLFTAGTRTLKVAINGVRDDEVPPRHIPFNSYLDELISLPAGDRTPANALNQVGDTDLYTSAEVATFVVPVVSGDTLDFGPYVAPATGPTASDFKLTGGEGVAEVTGTAVGNAITFEVVPTATYTGASVCLSEEVRVTVTHPGVKSREPVLADPGELIADATMLGKFGIEKTSVTGEELIAKTATDSIEVTLESTADPTKTTTYTLTFVEKI